MRGMSLSTLASDTGNNRSRYPRALSPLRIGPVTIPNRIVRAGHVTMLTRNGPVNQPLIDYHLARAKGGVGLTILEAMAVHPSSVLGLTAWSDGLVDGFRALVRAVEPHGMPIFQQLWHGGHIYAQPGGLPPWGPSDLPHPTAGIRPVPMRLTDIADLRSAYSRAARQCRLGGLHGIEIHAGHGYLIHQFLSPVLNRRTDAYGGSIDNRMRLLVELLETVRDAAGPDLAVGVRMSDSSDHGSLDLEDCAHVASALNEAGLIDYISLSHGDYYRKLDQIGTMVDPAGYQLPFVRRIAADISVPRLVTGRFRSLDEVEQVLREGSAEMVSMVRAHIAEPDIVRKTLERGAETVRPCLACNQGCIGRWVTNGRIGCVVNPAAGEEATLAEELIGSTTQPRSVLVVGGGPAGMEAARAAALRGHNVVLAEAQPRLGGMLNLLDRVPNLRTMADYRHWIDAEVYRVGVEVRTSTFVTEETVAEEDPDIVIVATGSRPDEPGFQASQPSQRFTVDPGRRILSSFDLLTERDIPLGATALVYDDVGDNEAAACAELLVSRGVAVTFVTRHASFAPMLDRAERAEATLDRLGIGDDFRLITHGRLGHAGADGVGVIHHGRRSIEIIGADTIVFVNHRLPLNELALSLQVQGREIRLVGDALGPRDLQVGIREGHIAGRSIS